MTQESETLEKSLETARERAGSIDRTGDWPAADLAALAAAGASRWAISREFGGDGLAPLELYLRYERIAASSLTLALIQSQRDSAVSLIEAAERSPIRREVLMALRDNTVFTTVGIAQLTTSRQGGRPALRATRSAGGWRIDGVIPWATGAAKCDFVVAGAALEDGLQLLFLLPAGRPIATADVAGIFARSTLPDSTAGRSVVTDPPLSLVALKSSWTGQVRCDGIWIPDPWVLRGPEAKVLGTRRNTLPLGQAFLAMGLCRGALDLIADHRSAPGERAFERLDGQLSALRRRIIELCAAGRETEATAASARVRGECNDLAIRITHAAVALYKGTALLDTHPAQRLAREAMFLLVWSCPDPVIDCTVDLLSGACQD